MFNTNHLVVTVSKIKFSYSTTLTGVPYKTWIDSGCSTSATYDLAPFSSYRSFDGALVVGNGPKIPIVGKGPISINCLIGNDWKIITLHEVLHIRGLNRNILSCGRLRNLRYCSLDEPGSNKWVFFDRSHGKCLVSSQTSIN